MSEILFLSHRIPYPPDKGDKIRSYHLLKALASGTRCILGRSSTTWRIFSILKL